MNLSWLSRQFVHALTEDAEQQQVIHYTRAYMLTIFGGWVFIDKSGSLVHLMFLQLMEDFGQARQYS